MAFTQVKPERFGIFRRPCREDVILAAIPVIHPDFRIGRAQAWRPHIGHAVELANQSRHAEISGPDGRVITHDARAGMTLAGRGTGFPVNEDFLHAVSQAEHQVAWKRGRLEMLGTAHAAIDIVARCGQPDRHRRLVLVAPVGQPDQLLFKGHNLVGMRAMQVALGIGRRPFRLLLIGVAVNIQDVGEIERAFAIRIFVGADPINQVHGHAANSGDGNLGTRIRAFDRLGSKTEHIEIIIHRACPIAPCGRIVRLIPKFVSRDPAETALFIAGVEIAAPGAWWNHTVRPSRKSPSRNPRNRWAVAGSCVCYPAPRRPRWAWNQ